MTEAEQKYNEKLEKLENLKKNNDKKTIASNDELTKKLENVNNDLSKSLEKLYSGEKLVLVQKQLNVMFDLITKTNIKYKYSLDYREGIDNVIQMIVSGAFL